MTPIHTNARDVALQRLSRVNRWMIAGSVALTAVFSEVAASAFPGRSSKAGARSSGVRAHPKSHSSTESLKAPSETPRASTTPEASPPAQETAPAEPSSPEPSESSPPPESSEAAPSQEVAPPAEQPAPLKEETAPAPAETSPPVVSGGS